MLRKLAAYISKRPHLIITLSLILVMLSGVGANHLVMLANDGKMPVATEREYIFFGFVSDTVAEKMLPFIEEDTPLDNSFDSTHTALTRETRLPLLADRIYVSIPETAPAYLPPWTDLLLLHTWFKRNGVGGTISIGDALQWTGCTLLIFFVLLHTLLGWCMLLMRPCIRK